jgi:hypothetical protein
MVDDMSWHRTPTSSYTTLRIAREVLYGYSYIQRGGLWYAYSPEGSHALVTEAEAQAWLQATYMMRREI